jgi:prepilin-type N-terminal cleavage/methylation domain-containing protein
MSRDKQSGFTIIELMISTAVFSTILLVVLTAITQIGRMYYKGVTTAQTQDVARKIIDRVSQEIQFSGESGIPISGSGVVNPNTKVICIGNTRFFYVINRIFSGSSHALWADTQSGCTAANVSTIADSAQMNLAQPTPVANNGAELLSANSRIVDFSTSSGGNNLWAVKIKVVFGADDLIEAIDASGNTVSQALFPALTTCKGSAIGTQFCAISELSTTVLKRVP